MINNKKVLITGSTGFIGSHVVQSFTNLGYEVIGINRRENSSPHVIRNITANTDWSDLLEGIDIIVHCAAEVHQMDSSDSILSNYQETNLEGTLNLANQAKSSVKRFIFLSTVKVNGEETFEQRFCADDAPNPSGPYAISKANAENGLKEIAKSSKMEVVIIRSPLVYGPNPKGNLEILSKFLQKKIPLPFGSITYNSRSLVYVGNLIDFICVCSEHSAAKNETFLVSDDEDLSTVSMISILAEALNTRAILLPVPAFILRVLFKLLGKKEYQSRLLGNLAVDINKNKELLDWNPKFSINDGFYHSFKN